MIKTDRLDLAQAKRLFCIFVARGYEPEEAVRRAGVPVEGDAARTACLLLGDYAVRRRIARLAKALAFCSPESRARAGLERLALGGDGEGFSFEEGAALPPGLLFHIAEIKRPKGGGIELRFFDRLKALSMLAGMEGQGEEGSPLLEALSRSAQALCEKAEERHGED